MIPNGCFSFVPEEIWNKREKKSCITLLCRYRATLQVLSSLRRSRGEPVCRMPDILHQKQEVIKAMCKISLLLLHHYRQEAPKRKYTPSGSAQKMRHFHHFLASFYPRQKKSKKLRGSPTFCYNSSHTTAGSRRKLSSEK